MNCSKITIYKKIKKIIEKVSKKYDGEWIKRKRKIDSKFLIDFIFQLVIKGRKGYGIIISEMWEKYGDKKINKSQENRYAQSTICEARKKLSPTAFREINSEIIKVQDFDMKYKLMGKHRVYAIDGTKVRLRKELEKEGYKKFNRDAYFPSGLLSCMYDVNTHIVHDFAITKSFSERDRALEHIEKLEENDILIMDRGYFSYLLLRKIVDQKAHGLFRIQGNLRNKEIIRFMNSSRKDMVVKYSPSETVKSDLRKIGHDINFSEIKLRLLKRKIKGKLYVFATTLTKSEYKAKMFDDLYHKRWDIEELYKISKEHFGIEEMHAKTDIGVRQEIYAHIVLINIARLLEHGEDEVEDNKKVNFKACLTAIENCVTELIHKGYKAVNSIVIRITDFISKAKYRFRPNRSFLRITRRPIAKWTGTYT